MVIIFLTFFSEYEVKNAVYKYGETCCFFLFLFFILFFFSKGYIRKDMFVVNILTWYLYCHMKVSFFSAFLPLKKTYIEIYTPTLNPHVNIKIIKQVWVICKCAFKFQLIILKKMQRFQQFTNFCKDVWIFFFQPLRRILLAVSMVEFL